MRKLGRAELRPYTMRVLKTVQSMLCPICGNEISLTVMGNKSDYVVDHDHNTGEVRGILHRGCNSAEGKVRAAIQSWGKQGNNQQAIIKWAKNLVGYWEQWELSPSGLIYPSHKTAEEKAHAARVAARTASAKRRAALAMKKAKEQT